MDDLPHILVRSSVLKRQLSTSPRNRASSST